MQLIKLATFTALIMTVAAAVPGAVHMRQDIDDSVELFERANCANIAKIKRPNVYDKDGYAIQSFYCPSIGSLIYFMFSMNFRCVPEKSKGFLSSHNCAKKGGTAYLCVQSGSSFCVSGKANVKGANYENGECFL